LSLRHMFVCVREYVSMCACV